MKFLVHQGEEESENLEDGEETANFSETYRDRLGIPLALIEFRGNHEYQSDCAPRD
jgi:hypothetical protein